MKLSDPRLLNIPAFDSDDLLFLALHHKGDNRTFAQQPAIWW